MAGGANEKCGENGVNLQFLWLVLLLYVEMVFVFCEPEFQWRRLVLLLQQLMRTLEKFGLKKGGSRELLIILIIMIINF